MRENKRLGVLFLALASPQTENDLGRITLTSLNLSFLICKMVNNNSEDIMRLYNKIILLYNKSYILLNNKK